MSYFDIDNYIAGDERVPCRFLLDVTGMGSLDPSKQALAERTGEPAGDLDSGTRLDLPLWLAEALAPRGYLRIDLPRSLNLSTRQALVADATVVKLREKSPVFYALAARLAAVSSHREARFLPGVARAALADRANMIIDRASASASADVSEWASSLTSLEKELFMRGYEQYRERAAWRLQKTAYVRPLAHAEGADPWQGAGTASAISEPAAKRAKK